MNEDMLVTAAERQRIVNAMARLAGERDEAKAEARHFCDMAVYARSQTVGFMALCDWLRRVGESAQQPAAPAVPRKTNRELHESAAGMNLSDSFFSHSGIDPDGYPPDSVTAPAVPDGFALVEVAVIDDEWLAVAMRDADIVRRVCADDSEVISAAINAYLIAASRKNTGQREP